MTSLSLWPTWWILMMTMLPVAVYQETLTTAEVLVLTAIAIGPGIGLYWWSLRGKGSGSDAGGA